MPVVGYKFVTNAEWAKDLYVEPHPLQGALEANNSLHLVCIDLTKINYRKEGKENVLVITNVFYKCTAAIVTCNQMVQTVNKVLIDKWFYAYGIPS